MLELMCNSVSWSKLHLQHGAAAQWWLTLLPRNLQLGSHIVLSVIIPNPDT